MTDQCPAGPPEATAPPLTGEVVVRVDVTVIEAPDRTSISLEVLASSDPRGLHVYGDSLCVGSGDGAVWYQVTGWDPDSCGLLLEKRTGPTGNPL